MYTEARDVGGSEWGKFAPGNAPQPLCKLVTVQDDSLAPRLSRGDMVAIVPGDRAPAHGQVVLLRARSTGAFLLRRFRPLCGGDFEAVDDHGAALHSRVNGLELVGVARGVRLRCL